MTIKKLHKSGKEPIEIVSSFILWPLIVLVPIFFTYQSNYKYYFDKNLYDITNTDYWNTHKWPSPIGLILGILAVVVGQTSVLIYFFFRKFGYLGYLQSIQKEGATNYVWSEGLRTHLSQPEGFILLGGYLICTWMF